MPDLEPNSVQEDVILEAVCWVWRKIVVVGFQSHRWRPTKVQVAAVCRFSYTKTDIYLQKHLKSYPLL